MFEMTSERAWSQSGFRSARCLAAVMLLIVFAACAAPIGVERVSSRRAQAELTQNVLSSGKLSEKAQMLLRRASQEQEWQDDPEAVLEFLHDALSRPVTRFNAELRASLMDAAAELAFAHAAESGDRRYYLAAALYAWLYLFPSDPELRPSALDRGVRLSADLYNRGITLALTDVETGEVQIEDMEQPLPFGSLTVDFDEETLRWGDRELDQFVSLAELEVRGLNNRYRMPGLGAPFAARASAPGGIEDEGDDADDGAGDLIFSNVRVPVSVLMRFQGVSESWLDGDFKARASIVAFSSADDVLIEGQRVPIEVEPSASLALQLTEDPPWQRELSGFFQGDLAAGRLGLFSLTPYHRDRIPVVLVHGTASSAGRWADLLNDLNADRVLRRHYQFWLFHYNTGNPIAYSGWLLRKAIADLVRSLDPEDQDAVLRDLVVMGHSQGGLLTKLLAVDPDLKMWDLVFDAPPDQVEMSPASRELFEGSLLFEPSPYVARVIFLSTPHRGSRLATLGPARLLGRLVRAPANLVDAVGDAFSDDPEDEVRKRLKRGGGAVGNMSPDSPFIKLLADLPIAPGVHAHSIMGVKKGPKEEGSDGVVSYESAHLDDVESELVVQSGHSSQSNPRVVSEVRRILLEHLTEAFERGFVPSIDETMEPASAR